MLKSPYKPIHHRFVPKFVNGVWVVFDTMTFKHIGVFNNELEASQEAMRLSS